MKYLFLIGIIFGLANGGLAQDSNTRNYLSGSFNSADIKSNLNLVTPQSYQPFISEGKQWKYVQEVYLTGGSGANYLVNLAYFKGDTIVDNLKYSKLYSKSEQPFPEKAYLAYLMREDTVNQKVYVIDIAFKKSALLYDFKLNKGDVINMYITGGFYLKETVLNVDTITAYNKKRKRIEFDDSITWIEGIGCVTRGYIPSEGELICVRKNNDLLYLNPKFSNCDTIFIQGGYDNIQTIKSNEVMVFPNPVVSTSMVKVHSNSLEPLKIEIYSYSGALVKEDYFKDEYPIGSVGLEKGLYVYRIIQNRQVIKMDKILIIKQ